MSKSIFAILMLAVTATAFAGQALPSPHLSTRLGALRSAKPADPYRKLFDAPRGVGPAAQVGKAAAQPKMVCGMLIIPADPSIDPRMAIPPQSDGVNYQLRAIDPPTCNPAK